MTAILVALGAAVGAPTRYLVDVVVSSRVSARVHSWFPWGTMLVNLVGSLVLGLVAALVAEGNLAAWTQTLIGAGFCGALTTFSTFSYDTIQLAEAGRFRAATTNVAGSVLLCFAAVSLGWWLGTLPRG